jgi:hypothetical protein
MTLSNFADSVLALEFFKEEANWPKWLDHPVQLKEHLASYNEALRAYETDGGRKNMNERDQCRHAAQVSAVLIGQYVVMRSISEKKPEWLKNVALKLKTRGPKSSSKGLAVLTAPEHLTVDHFRNKQSGGIVVSYGKVAMAGTYEIQLCEDDPSTEANWKTVGQYAYCRVELTGLEPGKRLYFRVRCHGTGDPGPFTQPVSIIVI